METRVFRAKSVLFVREPNQENGLRSPAPRQSACILKAAFRQFGSLMLVDCLNLASVAATPDEATYSDADFKMGAGELCKTNAS